MRAYAKHIIAADPHYVVLLVRLEDYKCPLFNHIVIPEDDLVVLLLLLADNRAGWVDNTPLTEHYVTKNLVVTHVQILLRHTKIISRKNCSRFDRDQSS